MEQKRIIKILDEQTINQIAAGEVVENPASCIKELVENAIDAEATHVKIFTEKGGIQFMSVSDDGIGMSADEIPLAISRHATSKITSCEDLQRLQTFGFRGEALAAICSVCKVKIKSAIDHSSKAIAAHIEGGKIIENLNCARKRGTTIELCDLFYNLYARRQSLATPAREKVAIMRTLCSLALIHTNVGFEWHSDGKQELFVEQNCSLAERIELLLGAHYFQELIPISHKKGKIELSGFIGKAGIGRPNRRGQYLFINGRSIQSELVSEAIQEGYATRLASLSHPLFVLNLDLDPSLVDVNVHPQKKEVRFQNVEPLISFLKESIHTTFLPKEESKTHFTFTLPKITLPTSFFKKEVKAPTPSKKEISLKAIKLLPPYFFFERENQDLYLLDCEKASLLFIKEQIEKKESIPLQTILFPITFTCALHEAKLLEEKIPLLRQFGIALRPFGPNSFIIDAIASFLKEHQVKPLLEKIVLEATTISKLSEKRMAELFYQNACKGEITLDMALEVARKVLMSEKETSQFLKILSPENLARFF